MRNFRGIFRVCGMQAKLQKTQCGVGDEECKRQPDMFTMDIPGHVYAFYGPLIENYVI